MAPCRRPALRSIASWNVSRLTPRCSAMSRSRNMRIVRPTAGLPRDSMSTSHSVSTLIERRGDARGGEVLILDVDRLARGGDHVEIKLLDLAYRGRFAACRHRARDADFDSPQLRREMLWPRIAVGEYGL